MVLQRLKLAAPVLFIASSLMPMSGDAAAPKGALLPAKSKEGKACRSYCRQQEARLPLPKVGACVDSCWDELQKGDMTPAKVACWRKHGQFATQCLRMKRGRRASRLPPKDIKKSQCTAMCKAFPRQRIRRCYALCSRDFRRGHLNLAVLDCQKAAKTHKEHSACYQMLPYDKLLEVTRLARTVEAIDVIDIIFSRITTFVEDQDAAKLCQLPPSVACTPVGTACGKPKNQWPVDASQWTAPGWKAIDFVPQEPHYFRYCLQSKGDRFTITAHADQDCDGIWSTFSRSGTVVRHKDDGTCMIRGDLRYHKVREME